MLAENVQKSFLNPDFFGIAPSQKVTDSADQIGSIIDAADEPR
jgi:hypothetical protein